MGLRLPILAANYKYRKQRHVYFRDRKANDMVFRPNNRLFMSGVLLEQFSLLLVHKMIENFFWLESRSEKRILHSENETKKCNRKVGSKKGK